MGTESRRSSVGPPAYFVFGGPVSSRPSAFVLCSPGPLRLYSTAELLRLPPPAWLIDPILPAGGLIGLYGPPGEGKSFLAIDMALAVATGRPWQGHAVTPCHVVYISAEGGTGISKRVLAWLTFHHSPPQQADVAWLTESVAMLSDSQDMHVLFERIHEEMTTHPGFVVIDTLARCFEGDENKQEDMGHFIQGVDRLRREFGCTVMVVHHTRLQADRERGSTAFRGAADCMILVRKRQRTITVTNSKQKDYEEFSPLHFTLTDVPETQSCVLTMSKRTAEMLAPLQQGPLSWDNWFQRCSTSMSKSTFYREFMELKQKGQILKENGRWRLVVPSGS